MVKFKSVKLWYNSFRKIKSEFIVSINLATNNFQPADEYLNNNVLGKTSFADCLHSATTRHHQSDSLIYWNLEHIINVYRIVGYHSINIRND